MRPEMAQHEQARGQHVGAGHAVTQLTSPGIGTHAPLQTASKEQFLQTRLPQRQGEKRPAYGVGWGHGAHGAPASQSEPEDWPCPQGCEKERVAIQGRAAYPSYTGRDLT